MEPDPRVGGESRGDVEGPRAAGRGRPALPPASPAKRGREALAFFFDLARIVVLALAIIIPVRLFLVQPFYVKGASMEPNFYDHEYLLIDEISYRFREPARGEVVVFRYPKDPRQNFIKRIVALPGERVELSQNHVTIRNNEHPLGFELPEPYLAPGTETIGTLSLTLGPDEYLLFGDNRSSSLDSRFFGPVSKQFMVGRVWVRAWPVTRWTIFSPFEPSS